MNDRDMMPKTARVMDHGEACDNAEPDRPIRPSSLARRRELLALADRIIVLANEAGVKDREWCFLQWACELLADRD